MQGLERGGGEATTHAGDWIDHPGTGAEVGLDVLTRLDLDAPDALRRGTVQAPNEAFERLVGSGEPDLGHGVLVDALGAQAGLELGLDECRMRRATTGAPWMGNRRRNGPWTDRQTGG